jgi:hypothetical protein
VCVDSLDIAAPGGDFQTAKYLGSAKGGNHIAADPALNLYEGVTPSLFDAPNAPNMGGTTTYAVTLMIDEHFNHQTGQYQPSNLLASVAPSKAASGNYTAPYFDPKAKPENAYKGDDVRPGCVYIEDGSCGLRQDFTPGTRVRLGFHMPKTIGGWSSGRMKNPQISISDFSSTVNKAVIESEPVDVPKLAYVKNKADINVEKNFNIGRGGNGVGEWWGVSAGGPGSEDVFKFVDLYRQPLNDTAEGTISYWNFMTIGGGSGNGCLSDTSKVLGIVTTNAMGYDTTAPSFQDGFLNYKVTGLHYLPGGKDLALGTYDLVMRSETARCLYGFSNAPISATVSVISNNGEQNTATTTVVDDKTWLKMSAYGFTFSEKNVKVKITQAKDASSGSSSGLSTITCVKGKLTKKVSGTAPKCPAGYKKK